MHSTAHIFHAVADQFLVNIQTDVVHSLHGGASLVVSESARSLSSAFLHQALLHDLFIQTIRELLHRWLESKCRGRSFLRVARYSAKRAAHMVLPLPVLRFLLTRARTKHRIPAAPSAFLGSFGPSLDCFATASGSISVRFPKGPGEQHE